MGLWNSPRYSNLLLWITFVSLIWDSELGGVFFMLFGYNWLWCFCLKEPFALSPSANRHVWVYIHTHKHNRDKLHKTVLLCDSLQCLQFCLFHFLKCWLCTVRSVSQSSAHIGGEAWGQWLPLPSCKWASGPDMWLLVWRVPAHGLSKIGFIMLIVSISFIH